MQYSAMQEARGRWGTNVENDAGDVADRDRGNIKTSEQGVRDQCEGGAKKSRNTIIVTLVIGCNVRKKIRESLMASGWRGRAE